MSQLNLRPPRRFSGDTMQKMEQVYTYLYQMSEQLNLAVNSIDSENLSTDLKESVIPQAKQQAENKSAVESLRQLIVKTANTIKSEMDVLETTLRGEYVAVSDFGTYTQQLSNKLQADPSGISQHYSFLSDIQNAQSEINKAFQEYITQTEGYIRTGIVRYENEVPVFGVAVGQGLTTTQIDGNTVVSSAEFRSVFTAKRLSFFVGDNEVAYLSNNRLYISNITILGDVLFQDKWSIGIRYGYFVMKWIGE